MRSAVPDLAVVRSHAIMGARMSEANPRRRLVVIGLIVVALFAGLLTRLWFLQVAGGEDLAVAAQDNGDKIVQTPAIRGRILDAKGRVLAETKSGDVARGRAPAAHRCHAPEARGQPLGPARRVTEDITKAIENPNYPQYQAVPIRAGVSDEIATALVEHASDYPQASLESSYVRVYPSYGGQQLAAHAVGYVGRISPEEYAARKVDGYANDDVIGKVGAEKLFESELRGVPERERVQVNNRGLAIGSQVIREAQPGHDVQLTIDIEAQGIAEESLQQGIDGTRSNGKPATAGAVVVLDARTGAVVALASNPTFDPEPVRRRHRARRVARPARRAEHLRPRVRGLRTGFDVQDDHLGGAVAGPRPGPARRRELLRRGLLQVREQRDAMQRNRSGDREAGRERQRHAAARADGVERRLLLRSRQRVLERLLQPAGCDSTRWARAGSRKRATHAVARAGRRSRRAPVGYGIQRQAFAFGFGKATGVGLSGDQGGRIPTRSFNVDLNKTSTDETSRTWRRGDSASLAVGQGDVLVTPLQLANAYATFANGGTLYTPRIASAVLASGVGLPEGKLGDVVHTLDPQMLRTGLLTPEIRNPILEGLIGVVNNGEGTAYSAFRNYTGPTFAGKTGTAQVQNGKIDDTSWFVGFTNAENDPALPQYVVLSIVEQAGFGSEVSAPIAARVAEYLTTRQDPACRACRRRAEQEGLMRA